MVQITVVAASITDSVPVIQKRISCRFEKIERALTDSDLLQRGLES